MIAKTMDPDSIMIQSSDILDVTVKDELVQFATANAIDISKSLPPLLPQPVSLSHTSVIDHWYTDSSTER
jgi:hypothetical protein